MTQRIRSCRVTRTIDVNYCSLTAQDFLQQFYLAGQTNFDAFIELDKDQSSYMVYIITDTYPCLQIGWLSNRRKYEFLEAFNGHTPSLSVTVNRKSPNSFCLATITAKWKE